MTNKHAVLSPSGFKALMLCPGKPAMELGLPDQSSEYADEGAAAHFLGSECLLLRISDAKTHAGRRIGVDPSEGAYWADGDEVMPGSNPTFRVNDEMVEAVQVYLDVVRTKVQSYEKLGAGVELLVEQALPIGHITGEDGATGTGDCVIIASYPDGRAAIEVGDLKYGRGVEVDAEDNPQLKLYALGAMEKFGMVYDFTDVETWISQPRVSHTPSTCGYSPQSLIDWAEKVAAPAASGAQSCIDAKNQGRSFSDYLNPAEDACRFCKAKATCPALEAHVKGAISAEFTDLTTACAVGKDEIVETLAEAVPVEQLGAKMDAVALIEDWCKAIRGRVEKQLLNGAPVAGYKLVQGKQGNRAWTDAEAAEAMLKSMRLKTDEMYDFKVISPTTAEKVLKESPKRWTKISALITRSDGKPSVAPVSDKRPALEVKPVESEFSVIADDAGDLV